MKAIIEKLDKLITWHNEAKDSALDANILSSYNYELGVIRGIRIATDELNAYIADQTPDPDALANVSSGEALPCAGCDEDCRECDVNP